MKEPKKEIRDERLEPVKELDSSFSMPDPRHDKKPASSVEETETKKIYPLTKGEIYRRS